MSLPLPPKRFADGSGSVGFIERDIVVPILTEDLDQRGIGNRRPHLNHHGAAIN